jgi:hypothetical protein
MAEVNLTREARFAVGPVTIPAMPGIDVSGVDPVLVTWALGRGCPVSHRCKSAMPVPVKLGR